jgi:hypothetical protein
VSKIADNSIVVTVVMAKICRGTKNGEVQYTTHMILETIILQGVAPKSFKKPEDQGSTDVSQSVALIDWLSVARTINLAAEAIFGTEK